MVSPTRPLQQRLVRIRIFLAPPFQCPGTAVLTSFLTPQPQFKFALVAEREGEKCIAASAKPARQSWADFYDGHSSRSSHSYSPSPQTRTPLGTTPSKSPLPSKLLRRRLFSPGPRTITAQTATPFIVNPKGEIPGEPARSSTEPSPLIPIRTWPLARPMNTLSLRMPR